ncbi:hypothetical protein OG331_47325 [Streptomyces sp. NBC_01017]|uniref:hypothetical protein n=1 Tax=Streptomyces sp. NBC_01017 TaxID=2903721 RepID=UPI00386A38FB|nr:hypothetical protein OG331_47325 [Streptomyces sp. NBC_01017]
MGAPDTRSGRTGRQRHRPLAAGPAPPRDAGYYLGWGPQDTSVEDFVLVSGARWRVKEAIKLA